MMTKYEINEHWLQICLEVAWLSELHLLDSDSIQSDRINLNICKRKVNELIKYQMDLVDHLEQNKALDIVVALGNIMHVYWGLGLLIRLTTGEQIDISEEIKEEAKGLAYKTVCEAWQKLTKIYEDHIKFHELN